MAVLEYEALIRNLVEMLGPENVVQDPRALEEYAKDHSFVKSVSPLCIVYPRNKDDIKKVIEFANEHNVPLIPVSSGPPHFRGDTVPRQGGIIVNLSKLKKILRIDARNRAVIVEPGVTFGELVPELAKHGLRLNMPLLPRASKSVVTNYLEREPPTMPKYQFDYVDPLLTMEVIFGTGDEFRTGTASGPGSLGEFNADMVNPFGPGDVKYFKLLSNAQGTLGIVTWAMVKAEAAPKIRKIYFIPLKKGEDAIEPMNKLLRYGIMGSVADEIFALNNFNLTIILADKWPEDFEALRKNLPPWTIIVCLGGYRLAEERVKVQEKCLMDVAQRLGLEPTPSLPGGTGKEKLMLELLSKPWDKEPYWKLRPKGSCSEISFLAPPSRAASFIEIISDIASKYGYSARDIGGYIQPVLQGNAYHMEFDVPYNPLDEAEVDFARRLFLDASTAVMKNGGFFSRPYGPLAEIVYNGYAEGVEILKKVKDIFDPKHILNPGVLSIF